MSKELEMLRRFVDDKRYPAIDRTDLRRILRRLEAAERVCEKIEVLIAEPDDAEDWRPVHKALAAYRALDGEETK